MWRNVPDYINHPPHYTDGRKPEHEPIAVIEAWDLGYHLGNAVKYISRAGRKEGSTTLTDLHKARWYLDRKIKVLEDELLDAEMLDD